MLARSYGDRTGSPRDTSSQLGVTTDQEETPLDETAGRGFSSGGIIQCHRSVLRWPRLKKMTPFDSAKSNGAQGVKSNQRGSGPELFLRKIHQGFCIGPRIAASYRRGPMERSSLRIGEGSAGRDPGRRATSLPSANATLLPCCGVISPRRNPVSDPSHQVRPDRNKLTRDAESAPLHQTGGAYTFRGGI